MRWVPVVTALTLAVGSAAGGVVHAAPPMQQDPSVNGMTEQAQDAPPTLDIRSAAAAPDDGGFGPNATTVAVQPIISQPTEDQLAQVEQAAPIAAAPQQASGFEQVTDSDADGDRIPDRFDNCPWNANTGQEDWDGDGVGDACAQAVQEAAAAQPEPDADGDGVPDYRDNCWLIHNPNQTDGDGDGLGNGCDEGSTPSHYSAEQPVSAERTVVEATLNVAGQPVEGAIVPDAAPADDGGRNRDRSGQDAEAVPAEEVPADDGGRDRDRRGDADRVEPVEPAPEPSRLDRGQDPVSRGDRPRRNPDLTEESGPVLPPPRNTKRMDAATVAGWEPVVRVDAGQIGVVARSGSTDAGDGLQPGPQRHAPDRASGEPDAGDGVPAGSAPASAVTPAPTPAPSSGALPVPVEQDGGVSGGQPPALEEAVGLLPGVVRGWQAAPAATVEPSSTPEARGGVVLVDSAPDPGDSPPAPNALRSTADPGDGPAAPTATATPVSDAPVDGGPEAGATAPSRLESAQDGSDGKRDRGGKRSRKQEQAAEEPWQNDDGYRGGEATISASGDIAGTDEDAVYLTQRTTGARDIDNRFVYAIEVPADGVYRVRLHFAETYWGVEGGGKGKKGARVFDVDAEGEPALQRFDINAEVGPMTAVVKMFDVEVDDGTLELEFRGVVDRPTIAAIEVLQAVDKLPPVDADRARRAKAALDEIP